jgi:hypothetical protein
VSAFAAEIKNIFERWQLAEYLEKARDRRARRAGHAAVQGEVRLD